MPASIIITTSDIFFFLTFVASATLGVNASKLLGKCLKGTNTRRTSGAQTERPKMEIWRFSNATQPGMVVIKQFGCFPRLSQNFCTFCLRVHQRGLLLGADYKGEQKAFLRGSNHSADPINQWQKQSCWELRRH